MAQDAPGGRLPLPDESLDALVVVLDEVRLGRSRSRSELVARTGLGRGIVAQRVGELLERGLVVEGEVGPSTGGRPPRQLAFRASAGHVLVADLGATSIDVAITDLDGRILGHHDEPSLIEAGPDVCLGRVDELFELLQQTTHAIPGPLWGIGIGVPGPVEFQTGRPISPPIMPGWDGYPIRERFALRYAAPVWVDNDVNVLALGEWRSGVAAAALDGRSGRLRTALDQRGMVTAEDVARAASFGDPIAVALLQETGRRVGSMLASVVNFFNPSLIVIGGGVANSPDTLLASIRETVYRRSLPLATRELLIQRSSLGGLAGVIGASSMVVDQLFSRDAIAAWIEEGNPTGVPDLALAALG
jgi:predicted NBD/HSP70 family sugar kinase